MKTIRAKIAQQTLELLITREWKSISINLICRKLKLSKKKISRTIKNKNDLLKNINKYFDDKMLVEVKLVEKSTSQDMIFEIFMLRFDLLNRYRISIIKIFKIFQNQPKTFIVLIPSFIESIEMMAKESNIVTKGMVGIIKLNGLLIIYFSTFLTWIKDKSPSLDKTMTVLDDYLKGSEKVLKLLKK